MPSIRSLENSHRGIALPSLPPPPIVLADGTTVTITSRRRQDGRFPYKPGEQSSDIWNVQHLLNLILEGRHELSGWMHEAGVRWQRLTEDGFLNPETEAALKDVQEHFKLSPTGELCWPTVMHLHPYLRLRGECLDIKYPRLDMIPPKPPVIPPKPKKVQQEEHEEGGVELSFNLGMGLEIPIFEMKKGEKPEAPEERDVPVEIAGSFDLSVPLWARRRSHLTFHIIPGVGELIYPKRRFLTSIYFGPDFGIQLGRKGRAVLSPYLRAGLHHGKDWSANGILGLEVKFELLHWLALKIGGGVTASKIFGHGVEMAAGFETGFEFVLPDFNKLRRRH